MREPPSLDRILASLNDAMLDDARWPSTSALIDEACGIRGNMVVYGSGSRHDEVTIYLARLLYRGERNEQFEHLYFEEYYEHDERVPRFRTLPDSRLIHVGDLYTDEEKKTSRAYNEALPLSHTQHCLSVRMDGPNRSRIVWSFADPVDGHSWSSTQVDLIQALLPHLRQYVRMRQALADAAALGASLTGLLEKTGSGVIQLDWRGRIVAANDRARGVLRTGDALLDEGGRLTPRIRADQDALLRLVARALPRFGAQGVSGSLTLSRPDHRPGLTVHVTPVGHKESDCLSSRVAALVLLVDHAPTRVDPVLVESLLGLTPTESRIAVLLAEGRTTREIAAMTGRQFRTVRWHVEQIYAKREIRRKVDLVREVLLLAGSPFA